MGRWAETSAFDGSDLKFPKRLSRPANRIVFCGKQLLAREAGSPQRGRVLSGTYHCNIDFWPPLDFAECEIARLVVLGRLTPIERLHKWGRPFAKKR
jgi:hypothetical protein